MNAELKYKNVGLYCEELSARWEAKASENFIVRLWKCPHLIGFRFDFLTTEGHDLGDKSAYNVADLLTHRTKIEIKSQVNKLLSDPEFFKLIEKEAIYVRKQMEEFAESLKARRESQG